LQKTAGPVAIATFATIVNPAFGTVYGGLLSESLNHV